MKKLLATTFAITTLSFVNIYAQQDFQLNGQQIYTLGIGKKADVQGTKYLNENFILAKIDDYVKDFPLRYNAFDNEFEYKENIASIIKLDKIYNKITFVTGQTFILIPYKDLNNNTKQEYIELVHASGNILFKTNKIKYIEAKEPVNGYDSAKPAKYLPAESSYILKYKDQYFEIPKKAKELENLFPEKSNELKSFIKSNKLKLDKEESLIKLAQFLNN